jgi:hypothetical protein
MSKPTIPEPKPDPMIARDLVGYGEFPPHPAWPGGAHIAVNFNLNIGPVRAPVLTSVTPTAAETTQALSFTTTAWRWKVPNLAAGGAGAARHFAEHAVTVSVLGVVRALELNSSWPRPA